MDGSAVYAGDLTFARPGTAANPIVVRSGWGFTRHQTYMAIDEDNCPDGVVRKQHN